jgi:exodeoxyribonuclease X
MKNHTTILIADTETTGLSPSDKVCEFAYALCRYDFDTLELRVLSHGSSLINPGRPIPEAVSAFHGITDAMVADSPTLEDYIAGQRLQGTFDYVGGHNYVRFDKRYLGMLEPVEGYVDTLWGSRTLFPDISHKLMEMVGHFEKAGDPIELPYSADTDAAHRAGFDTANTVGLLAKLLRMPYAWQALTVEPLPTKMPFGKHKGKTFEWLRDNDPGYVDWYVNKTDNPEARIIAAMKQAGCRI